MEKVVLDATVRETFGKSGCKHLRQTGQIPCVVYRSGKRAVNLQVDVKDLWHVLHTEAGENAIITLKIAGGEKETKKTVIVQEVQTDPLSDMFVHVDFHEISLKEKLKVKVPITVKGDAVGVQEDEGVLTQVMWDLEVECLPTEIPEHLYVHVDDLRIGDSVHVKEIELPGEVTVVGDPDQVVLSVSAQKAEEEPAEEEDGTEEGSEPEVIKKGKKEEDGEGAAEETASEGKEE